MSIKFFPNSLQKKIGKSQAWQMEEHSGQGAIGKLAGPGLGLKCGDGPTTLPSPIQTGPVISQT